MVWMCCGQWSAGTTRLKTGPITLVAPRFDIERGHHGGDHRFIETGRDHAARRQEAMRCVVGHDLYLGLKAHRSYAAWSACDSASDGG